MSTKQEFNCVFCKDVFYNKEDLQEHFRKHGDPNYKNRFELDSQASDEKSKEKVEMVSCDVCSQVFPTISKAITHKHKVHPDHDAKYFCPWCGKLFTMKHLYNVHVQSAHGNQEKPDGKHFQCDSCSVDFYIPSAMINHNKFFHRQDTDLPDIGQSKKVKFYNQEVLQIYYCAFCGEEYENKVNLIKHMSDDHGDENQSPEEVLKCPLCDAIFYHLDAYEIHLTFHSSEDMYSVENPEYQNLLDYSLETVPPIIEKVENLPLEDQNQDTDPESTINAVGIEKFLELAMDQSDDSNPVKTKKHKKHKKSKKSAITLDEFLSMNKDVFGEGLDFQGIEEIPTRVVKKRLKSNKKMTNTAVTSAELEKLKKAGIVIKRKVEPNSVIKGIKVTNAMPPIITQIKPVDKIKQVREIETSSEVLTKLMNQSNNQIRIVKKNNPNDVMTSTNEPKQISKDVPVEESHNMCDCPKETYQNSDGKNSIPATKTDNLSSAKAEEFPETVTSKESNIDSEDIKQVTEGPKATLNNYNKDDQKLTESSNLPTPVKNKQYEEYENGDDEYKVAERKKSGLIDSDPEFEVEESYVDKCKENYNSSDETLVASANNSNQDNKLSKSVDSLSSLKRLSHLITVKPLNSNQNKKAIMEEPIKDSITETSLTPENSNKKETTNSLQPTAIDIASPTKPKINVDKDPTMDALKTLGKNITIKSLSTKRNIDQSDPSDNEDDDTVITTSNPKLQDVSSNTNITIKKIKVENNEMKPIDNKVINKSLNSQAERKSLPVKQLVNKPAVGKIPNKVIVEKPSNSLPTSNANILKRLPNITTKSVLNKSNCSTVKPMPTNTAKKIVATEEKKEEIIEIFDIDDSDDEPENNSVQPEHIQNTKSMDALKHLSKNITVKSLNQKPIQKNITTENKIKVDNEDNDSQSNINNESNTDVENKNIAYKNILQGLCKNITIKSRNGSPNQFLKSQEPKKENQEDETSDSESCTGNIKITELENDMVDDDDNNTERVEKFNSNVDYPVVESPNESCSGNEELNNDLQDFEADIQVSTVQKCSQNTSSTMNSMCLNNLRNINKNITIKSLSKSPTDNEDKTKQADTCENQETPQSQKKQLPMKTSKQNLKELRTDNTGNTSSTQSSNKKLSAMNQVNTVNKEVTVQTFQTKTVIQEITTTVTKTIKTVNQTMKQEVRSTYQANSPIVTQRVHGIRSNQSKNLQGVVIRHAAPVLGSRASINSLPQIRAAGTVVRPARQVVPMRVGTNSTRPNNPRAPIGKKVTPSPSPNKQVIGRPLKISPSAMASTIVKRPNTEDVSGPFSCFKKPKESLIPVSDVPAFTNSGTEAIAQFTSAANTTSTNFASTTKIIKGNSVVTAKQTKSEVTSTSQQLSRLSSTSGLKVMSSQHKQSQVQEKCETSAMKRTTLEAIQKLQKQGLLVKKPRVDVSESKEESDDEGDNNVGYSSADEHDEK